MSGGDAEEVTQLDTNPLHKVASPLVVTHICQGSFPLRICSKFAWDLPQFPHYFFSLYSCTRTHSSSFITGGMSFSAHVLSSSAGRNIKIASAEEREKGHSRAFSQLQAFFAYLWSWQKMTQENKCISTYWNPSNAAGGPSGMGWGEGVSSPPLPFHELLS